MFTVTSYIIVTTLNNTSKPIINKLMAKTFKALARSKAIEILFALEKRKLNFGEVAKVAGNRPTAMRRLRELRVLGLVERREVGDALGSVEYLLTRNGRRLVVLLMKILKMT